MYARVSTTGHGRDTGLQLDELRLVARQRGWKVTEFVDEGVSGVDGHPAGWGEAAGQGDALGGQVDPQVGARGLVLGHVGRDRSTKPLTFELPEVPEGARQVRVEPSILYLLLEGIDLRADPRRWYRRPSD